MRTRVTSFVLLMLFILFVLFVALAIIGEHSLLVMILRIVMYLFFIIVFNMFHSYCLNLELEVSSLKTELRLLKLKYATSLKNKKIIDAFNKELFKKYEGKSKRKRKPVRGKPVRRKW